MYLGQPNITLLPMYEPEIFEPTPPVETPPWMEEPPRIEDEYTLPVEVIHTGYPVIVSRPEPVYAPIPTELEYPAPAAPTSNSGPLLAGLGLAALALLGATTKRGGKHG